MTSTKSETFLLAATGLVAVLLCSIALYLLSNTTSALLWALTSAVLWLLVWQQTHTRLTLNRIDASAPLYPDLGWANRMTIARGWLIAITGGALAIPSVLQEHPILVWVAAAAYSVAAIFDRLDGFIARKTQRSSLLGAELDTVFDALGLMVAPLLAWQLGKIHWSYLLVSVAFYLFVAGIHIRKRQKKPVYPLAPSKLRRTLAGFQMGYVAVVLWPPFAANVSALAGFGFMLPLLGGFLVDWGVVSGRINPNESKTSRLLHRMNLSTNAVVLPALRLALIPALFYIAIQAQWHNVSVAIAGISVLMITLGLAGRAGAIMLLMLLAWTVPMPVYAPVFVLMLFSAITIVLLGCGRYSWWQADDDWVNRQDGA